MRLDSKWRGGASQSVGSLLDTKMKAPPLKFVIRLPAQTPLSASLATVDY
jgi:hypothetical protein